MTQENKIAIAIYGSEDMKRIKIELTYGQTTVEGILEKEEVLRLCEGLTSALSEMQKEKKDEKELSFDKWQHRWKDYNEVFKGEYVKTYNGSWIRTTSIDSVSITHLEGKYCISISVSGSQITLSRHETHDLASKAASNFIELISP